MKVLQTRRDIDPNWQLHIDNLNKLVKLAGSPKRLSKLLGIKLSTVYSWGRNGRISILGALLVCESIELSRFFTFIGLRPDQINSDKIYYQKMKDYKSCKVKQKRYEESPNFKKESVIHIVETCSNDQSIQNN